MIQSRAVELNEKNIKAIWVFDGKPPEAKRDELRRRKEKKDKAKGAAEEAKEMGQTAQELKMQKMNIRVTDKMIKDTKNMLTLLGQIVVEAPAEAEAQCAEIVKAGKADMVYTGDMDVLTFGANKMLRRFSKDGTFVLINLQKVLDGFDMNMKEFIDLCILCGCDYTKTIRGVGPSKAFKMIEEHRNIEDALKAISNEKTKDKKNKFIIGDDFNYELAREFFIKPDVTDPAELCYKAAEFKPEEYKKFMIEEKNFGDVRINNVVSKVKKAK